jgi:hypothetical protein
MLRQAFGRLTVDEKAELSQAAAADRHAARWFRWLWLGGFAGVLGWFVLFMLPVMVVILRWAAAGVATGLLDGRFWYCLLCATVALGPQALAMALAAKEYAGRLVARRQVLSAGSSR